MMILLDKISKIYNEQFPQKKIKIKYNNRNSLVNTSHESLSNKQNALFKIINSYPTEINEIHYKIYRNKLHHLLRLAEKNYITNFY